MASTNDGGGPASLAVRLSEAVGAGKAGSGAAADAEATGLRAGSSCRAGAGASVLGAAQPASHPPTVKTERTRTALRVVEPRVAQSSFSRAREFARLERNRRCRCDRSTHRAQAFRQVLRLVE